MRNPFVLKTLMVLLRVHVFKGGVGILNEKLWTHFGGVLSFKVVEGDEDLLVLLLMIN